MKKCVWWSLLLRKYIFSKNRIFLDPSYIVGSLRGNVLRERVPSLKKGPFKILFLVGLISRTIFKRKSAFEDLFAGNVSFWLSSKRGLESHFTKWLFDHFAKLCFKGAFLLLCRKNVSRDPFMKKALTPKRGFSPERGFHSEKRIPCSREGCSL